jgi:hypothetical protein
VKTYPFSSPVILNDTIFTEYGGQTGSFTASQRNAAYLIAEQQTSNYIGTLLLPTTLTGTWGYAGRIVTDYGYVSRLFSVNILGLNNSSSCVLNSQSGCAYIFEDTYGYLDIGSLYSSCGCAIVLAPYQIQVAYQAGLPTGVASQPSFLLALTIAATINLNEMIFPSQNETTGDVGVERFSSLDYSETRTKLKRTAFGNSAKSQKIANLLDNAVKKARPALLLR